MYRCAQCSEVVGPNEPQHKVVTKTRPKRYPARERASLVKRRDKPKPVWVDDPGGVGEEIVTEVALCRRCRQRR